MEARTFDAEPGQVLVSNVVQELCVDKKLKFQSAGEAHMKGFDEPARAWSVKW